MGGFFPCTFGITHMWWYRKRTNLRKKTLIYHYCYSSYSSRLDPCACGAMDVPSTSQEGPNLCPKEFTAAQRHQASRSTLLAFPPSKLIWFLCIQPHIDQCSPAHGELCSSSKPSLWPCRSPEEEGCCAYMKGASRVSASPEPPPWSPKDISKSLLQDPKNTLLAMWYWGKWILCSFSVSFRPHRFSKFQNSCTLPFKTHHLNRELVEPSQATQASISLFLTL